MKDQFGRCIDYLRISVTDQCNLHCVYCRPLCGSSPMPVKKVLSIDEIVGIVGEAVRLGMRKFRLTGGEPLVRPDIVEIVAALARISGVDDLCMTTNGILLERLAPALAQAGLRRVNVSLDAVDPNRYTAITGGGDVRRVLAGITAAVQAGLNPVKLNCVVEKSSFEPDARDVAQFARENDHEVRFIRRMNLASGEFWIVEGGMGGDCPRCDRLRLTCDGMIRPCLFSDLSFDVRELGVETALVRAVERKPESGRTCREEAFCAVGG